MLAKFLEMSEDRLTIPQPREDSGPDLLKVHLKTPSCGQGSLPVNAGKHGFLVECKSSSARTQLGLAFMQLEEKRKTLGQPNESHTPNLERFFV